MVASRPPQGPAIAPVSAVLASADLRVRVDRETARGMFNLTGDVLRAGINRVSLLWGATLVEATAAGRPVPIVADGNAHIALLDDITKQDVAGLLAFAEDHAVVLAALGRTAYYTSQFRVAWRSTMRALDLFRARGDWAAFAGPLATMDTNWAAGARIAALGREALDGLRREAAAEPRASSARGRCC